MLPLMLIGAVSAQDAAPTIHPALQAARGRKVWMVGAPPEDCRRVEQELGLIVDCDTDWETSEDEVVIWCTEIPHDVGPALLAFLGRSHARVRTHQTNPAAAGTGECGQLFEITVRYPNTGTAAPTPTTSGSSGVGFTKVPPVSPAAGNPADPALEAIRGRKLWMIRAPESECDRVEQELGLIVDCDPDWNALASEEIVIWCTEIAHEAAPALLRYLGKEHYEVRTHQTNPAAAGTSECGMSFEITVRY